MLWTFILRVNLLGVVCCPTFACLVLGTCCQCEVFNRYLVHMFHEFCYIVWGYFEVSECFNRVTVFGPSYPCKDGGKGVDFPTSKFNFLYEQVTFVMFFVG